MRLTSAGAPARDGRLVVVRCETEECNFPQSGADAGTSHTHYHHGNGDRHTYQNKTQS